MVFSGLPVDRERREKVPLEITREVRKVGGLGLAFSRGILATMGSDLVSVQFLSPHDSAHIGRCHSARPGRARGRCPGGAVLK